MYALMVGQGEGGITDRAQAYAWMDLAAERGYPELLAQREQFWRALSSDERARAREIGESLYATYGDAVAKHRLERELRRGRFYKTDRKSVVWGKRVSVRVDLGGRRIIKKKKTNTHSKRDKEPNNHYSA